MTSEEKLERAAEYALGTLAGDDRRRVEIDMPGDPDLAQAVAEWEQRLAPLALDVCEEIPPDAVWTAITARLNEDQPAPGARTVFAEEGGWVRLTDGIEAKILYIDRAQRMRSCLLRCAPGTRIGAHEHARLEECLMLAGDLTFGTLTLGPGDYHVVPAGQPHPEGITRTGCLLFLRGDLFAKVA
jgi:quercetin dioxygenase-like cupin family protein